MKKVFDEAVERKKAEDKAVQRDFELDFNSDFFSAAPLTLPDPQKTYNERWGEPCEKVMDDKALRAKHLIDCAKIDSKLNSKGLSLLPKNHAFKPQTLIIILIPSFFRVCSRSAGGPDAWSNLSIRGRGQRLLPRRQRCRLFFRQLQPPELQKVQTSPGTCSSPSSSPCGWTSTPSCCTRA